ncbi:MAG: PAS domain S-box protein [Bacteroidales bacterium]|nr:PAS domain S-box protein [Bacteroidales bacterium]
MKKRPSYEELEKKVNDLESKLLHTDPYLFNDCSIFKQIIENSKEIVCICDEKGQIEYYNYSFAKLFVIPEISKKPIKIFDILSKESIDILHNGILKRVSTKGKWEGLLNAIDNKKKSLPIWVLIEKLNYQTNRSNFIYFIHDYTLKQKEKEEIKQKNEELEALTEELTESSSRLHEYLEKISEQEAYLKSIFKAAPVGIGVVVNRKFVYVNEQITLITGYSKEELIDKSARILYPTQEEYEWVGKEKYEQIAKQGWGTVETQWRSRNGIIKDILLSSCPFDPTNLEKGVTFSALDITERKTSEKRIKESEEKFSQAFMSGPDSILITNYKDGKIINVNDQFCITSGYKRNDVIGKSTLDINYWDKPDDRKKFISMLDKDGKVDNLEGIFRHKDGSTAPFLVSSRIITVEGVKSLITILKDISDRKKWEEQLKQASDIFNNMHTGLHIYQLQDLNDDRTLMMVNANPASEILTGVAVKDVIGKTLDENFPVLREKGIPQIYAEVVRTQQKRDIEDVYYGDDRVITGAFSVKAFPMPNNHVGVSFENITEKLKAMQILQESEAKLLEAQEVARIGNYSFNVVADTWSSSMVLDDIFGIDESFQKNMEGWLKLIHPDFKEEMSDHLLNHVLKNHNPFNKEYKIIHYKTKATKWIHGLGHLLFDENGQVISMVGTIQDITQRKKTETALLQSEENFRNLFNTIDEFLIIYNKKGQIISVNQTVLDRLGYTKDETLLLSIYDIHYLIEKEQQKQLAKILKGKEFSNQIPLKTKGGKILPVESRITQGKWNGKDALYSVSKDISELLLSEEKFNKAFHTTSHAMAISEIETGTFIEINKSFERITGYQRNEILGKSSLSINLFADKIQRKEIVELVKKNRYADDLDVRIRKKNGEISYGIFSASIIKLYDREFLLTAMNDITPRVISEMGLKESNRRFTEMLENIKMAAVMLDLNGNITFINDYLLNLSHWKKEEVLGKNWFEYFIPKETKLNELFNEKVPNGKFEPYFENEIITKWGERRLIGWNNTMLRNTEGKVTGSSSIGEDITEKKKAIEDLNRIFNLSADLICIASLEGYFLKTNPAFTKVLGYNEKELISQPFYEFIHPEDVESTQKVVAEKLNKGEVVINFENRYRCKDGNYVWLDWVSQPLIKEGITFAIARDVTRQKQTERDLIEAKERAEKSDRLKSVFLANMSHEIRTPMNGIMGFAELLLAPNKDEKQRERYAEIIWKKGNQLLQIINDLLDISKIEVGQIKIIFSEIDVNKMLDNLYDFYNNEVKQSEKKIELILETTLANEDSIIETDGSRLEQILTNLLSNALKFTEKGRIEFGYNLKNNELQFYVKDTGIGIDSEHHTLIFDQFSQATDNTTQLYGGTGLGLSIAKGLSELLHGKIWVESQIGKGACFYFTIPYKRVGKSLKPKSPGIKSKYNWPDKLILIVDDDEVSTDLLSETLSRTKAEIITTETGMEAIDICINNKDIDLVLMDIRLPDIDGYEATKGIKKFRKDLPIIAQTANAMPEDKERSAKAGCDDFIAKPISREKLLSLLGKYLK